MAETSIQWTATPRPDGTVAPGYTFNPWIGCAKISPGCAHCYASVDTYARVSASRGLPLWGKDAHRHVTGDDNWKKPHRWNRDAATAGERRKVFCASLADVFEARDDLDAHRARLWSLIEATPHLDWLLLTKRPEEIMRRMPERWHAGLPANVWVGTTIENQAMAEERIPHLLRVRARVRFLSIEPMLEEIDIDPPTCPTCSGHKYVLGDDDATPFCQEHEEEMCFNAWLDPCADEKQAGINFVICGGESGHRARPFDVAWMRGVLRQCREAHVAAFAKQLGAHVIWDGMSGPGEHWPSGTRIEDRMIGQGFRVHLGDRAGGDMAEWPEDLRVRAFPEVTP